MAGTAGNALQSMILDQMAALGERMDRGFDEVKSLLSVQDERIRALETAEAGCQPMVNAKIDAAMKRIDEHDLRIKTLYDLVTTQTNVLTDVSKGLATTNTILKWVLGIFTAVMTAIIVMLMTGQATLIFK